MDLEAIGKSAMWWMCGVGSGAAGYVFWAMYRMGKHEREFEYEHLLDDYDKRISGLPTDEKIRVLNIYHSMGAIRSVSNARVLEKIESKLKKDLAKRKEHEWQGVPICNVSEATNRENRAALDYAESVRKK